MAAARRRPRIACGRRRRLPAAGQAFGAGPRRRLQAARTGKVKVSRLWRGPDRLTSPRAASCGKVNVPVTGDRADGYLHRGAGAGRYAVAVHHDLNGNGSNATASDGGGFSRNPEVSLLNLKPPFTKTAVQCRQRPRPVGVTLALSPRPLDRAGERVMARTADRPAFAIPSRPGNLAQLPRIRAFCAEHPDIFHYEVEHADQIGEAMRTIARVAAQGAGHQWRRRHRPGGADRAVQWRRISATTPPPVAVLPNGKTNLIALDLGAQGDPVEALERAARASPAPTSPAYRRARADRAVAAAPASRRR